MSDRSPMIFDRTSAGTAGADSRRLDTGGFTLIEVLVVVAIIALLVSILIPAFVSARDSARLVVCQSNQKQIAMAWHSYLVDSRDRLPRGTFVFATFGGKQGRCTNYGGPGDTTDKKRFLNRYLKLPEVVGGYPHGLLPAQQAEAMPAKIPDGVRVFQCPSATNYIWINTEQIHYSHFDYYGTSYRTNRFLIGPMPPSFAITDPCRQVMEDLRLRWGDEKLPVNLSVNISTVANTSRMVLMGDYSFSDWQHPTDPCPPQEFHNRAQRKAASLGESNWGYYNIAFLDGHVAYTGICKGIYVNPSYTMIPFRDLQQRFAQDQRAGFRLSN